MAFISTCSVTTAPIGAFTKVCRDDQKRERREPERGGGDGGKEEESEAEAEEEEERFRSGGRG